MNQTFMELFGPGDAKVSYLVDSIMDKNIGGLEIPMYNIKLAQIGESFAHLKEHIHKLIQPIASTDAIIALILPIRIHITIIQQIPEVTPITVLSDNIKELVSLKMIAKWVP